MNTNRQNQSSGEGGRRCGVRRQAPYGRGVAVCRSSSGFREAGKSINLLRLKPHLDSAFWRRRFFSPPGTLYPTATKEGSNAMTCNERRGRAIL